MLLTKHRLPLACQNSKVKKLFKKAGRLLFRLLLGLFLLSILSVVIFRFVPVPITPLMVIRSVEQWQDDRPVVLKKTWKPLKKIAPHLHLAVVCAEDQNFLNHRGFDFGAIEKAMEHNKKSKRKRGASTISQQTAKNLFLWPGRSWLRKGLEVYFTVLIEFIWPKERIMEVYLNIIEFGDGVYGAEAAAQFNFNQPAEKINRSQAALLAAVLPNPRQYSAKNPGPYVRTRQTWILGQMTMWGNRLDYNSGEES